MPKEKVLVTGGAGFIGRHVCKRLLERGDDVVVFDAIIDQVHGVTDDRTWLEGIQLVRGDIRDAEMVRTALNGVDAVVHLAAEVGVGQSMYAIERYVGVNDRGTAVLMEELSRKPVRRVVVASSMSIYGEGLYQARDGSFVENATRAYGVGSTWDPIGDDGGILEPIPTRTRGSHGYQDRAAEEGRPR